jgi:hypothetical protein
VPRLPLTLLALALFAACGPAKEKEPNDHFTQATAIKPKGEVKGTIGAAGDVDVYKLEPTADLSLSLHLPGIRDVDFVLSLQDQDRQELKKIDETVAGGDEYAVDLGLKAGTYYLQVSNKNPAANNPQQVYTLTLVNEPLKGHESEPNDKPIFATPMTPGELMKGHFFPSQNLLSSEEDRGEEDWFRIDLATGVFRLNLDLSEVPKIDSMLEVYDANNYKLKEADGGGAGAPESLRDFGIKGPAQYFIRLRSKTRAGNSDVGYQLLSELLPYEGRTEFEPNEQRPDATPMANDSITGHIAPAGDVDWFKIAAATETKQILRADLTPVPGMDLVMTVADDLGNAILTVDNAGRDQPEIMTGLGVRQGEYHLVVSEKSGKASDSRRTYALNRSLYPFQPGLEFELNDSTAAAQALKVGESVDGYASPKGDVDWYEFNVYQKGNFGADLSALLNVSFAMTLLDQDGQELAAKAGAKNQPLSIEKDLEPGTYWLKLAAGPDQSNVRDKYTLRLRIR